MTSDRKTADPRAAVRYDDVDDVIEIASQLANADADALSVDQLKAIAAEIDVSPEHIERAVERLETRRRAEEDRRHRVRRRAILGSAVALGALLVIGAAAAHKMSTTRSALRESLSHVEHARAQVHNVIERKAQVEARLRGEPELDARARDAELAGSDNRIAIERRRYDHAATHYNNASAEAWDWARGDSLPARVPLSTEVRAW